MCEAHSAVPNGYPDGTRISCGFIVFAKSRDQANHVSTKRLPPINVARPLSQGGLYILPLPARVGWELLNSILPDHSPFRYSVSLSA
jgi:hypothetical protein